MEPVRPRKPHAVCVPYPSQGHVTPMMQLAKLLHSSGFHITFVNTEFNHKRLADSNAPDSVKGLPDFAFEAIPDGLSPPDVDAIQDVPSLCDSTRKNCLAPFRELLRKLNSSAGIPPVTCVVSDGVMSFGIKAAEEFGIKQVQFWTASACSFMGYLHFSELIRRGFKPFKDERDGTGDTVIDWIPGMKNIRIKDMPTFLRTTNNELMFEFMGSEAQNCLNSSAIIFNTFYEFEHEVLDAITATKFPRIYTVGPLPLLAKHVHGSHESGPLVTSLWKEDSRCLEWLDERETQSVIYVNFGSVAIITEKNLREFALGLAGSNHPFLWILRPDLVTDVFANFIKGFLEETRGRGLVASWCSQQEVLSHPSVAAFLTHCGWNSMMEAVSCGKPILCWPFFADQHTNCRYACTKWGIGLEVNSDVKGDDIKVVVKEMLEGVNGKKLRQKALEWKRKAEAATGIGGSSYDNFTSLIKQALMID